MVRCWRIQISLLGQSGRTDGHAEDVGGILVVAPRPDVGIGQLGAHEGRHDQLEAASRWVMAGGQLLDFCANSRADACVLRRNWFAPPSKITSVLKISAPRASFRKIA